jgi:hypothetical protein
MADGFYVDFGALQKAAEGVTDTLDAMATRSVNDIDAPKSAFGHDRLGDTVADFCDRWEIGIEHLARDAQEVADRLTLSVKVYLHAERTLHESLDGILQSPTGPDPAAQ